MTDKNMFNNETRLFDIYLIPIDKNRLSEQS